MGSVAAAPSNAGWYTSLDAAYLHAQQFRQPMLVFIGSDAVASSRQAWATVSRSDATRRWTAIRLDADTDRGVARSLGVVETPTLLALTSDGRRVATLDQVTPGLEQWLATQFVAATHQRPAAASVDELVRQLGDADAQARESAVRQLRDQPAAAARSVLDLLRSGSLQQRLAAADLWDGWKAPGMEGVDPWANQDTRTAQQVFEQTKWVRAVESAPRPTTAPTAASATDDLDALAAAPTAIAAGAVRERLLRFGPALLPQVVARLKTNVPDPARGRLAALRYRLCATDRLAADWPGGFDRVTSTDAQVRRQAAADLVTVAKAEDAPLLTELFADADPFVREQSLKALRAVGGSDTNRALVRLLADPEPNVRAAVLNTLADSPDETLGGDLARFAAAEPEVDLVVHAVHVLELTPGGESFRALVSLLDHPQWRVRGEAAESLLGRISGRESDGVLPSQTAAAYAGLEKRLDDPEGYVVTRAAGTLIKSGLSDSIGPLMAVAERRPDVARDVLKALANDSSTGTPFVGRIRKLARSQHASVRSAAIAALVELDPNNCGADVATALGDADASVRAAAVRATVAVLSTLKPNDDNPGLGDPITPAGWYAAFRAGRGRPQWLTDGASAMEQAMRTADAATRVDAAVVLCALGRDDQVWPVLTAAAARPADAATVAPALPWLPWARRSELFTVARKAGGSAAVSSLLEGFTAVPDDRAAAGVWDLLGPGATDGDFEPVLHALNKIYVGSEWGYNGSQQPPAKIRAAIDVAKARVSGGADLQRSAGLAILLEVSPADAEAAAMAVGNDPKISDGLREDALRVRLLAQPPEGEDTAVPIAMAAMNDAAHPSLRKVGLSYLASGGSAITELRGGTSLYVQNTRSYSYSIGDGHPILVKPPVGLTAGPLREVLATPGVDGDQAGYAGYLLVLLGDPSGMDPLMAAARAHALESPWNQLVYRAIAKNDDGTRVPVLTEIYESMLKRNKYELREFYWTIRPMTGPAILKLRKRVRDEYGMDNLK